MKSLNIWASALVDLQCSSQISVVRHRARDLLGVRLELTPEAGEGYSELTRVQDDLLVVVSHFARPNPNVEFVSSDGLLQFAFCLSGNSSCRVSRTAAECVNRSLRVWAQPQYEPVRSRGGPSSNNRRVTISIRPEFLLETFLPSNDDLPSPLRDILLLPVGQCCDCQLPLTAEMMDITSKIANSPPNDARGLTYIESWSFQLLCLAVGGLSSLPDRPSEEYSAAELQALRVARRMFLDESNPDSTLRNIADAVGLSEMTLTRGLRTVYGETLFDLGILRNICSD